MDPNVIGYRHFRRIHYPRPWETALACGQRVGAIGPYGELAPGWRALVADERPTMWARTRLWIGFWPMAAVIVAAIAAIAAM
jgi:hypothetical protein